MTAFFKKRLVLALGGLGLIALLLVATKGGLGGPSSAEGAEESTPQLLTKEDFDRAVKLEQGRAATTMAAMKNLRETLAELRAKGQTQQIQLVEKKLSELAVLEQKHKAGAAKLQARADVF